MFTRADHDTMGAFAEFAVVAFGSVNVGLPWWQSSGVVIVAGDEEGG